MMCDVCIYVPTKPVGTLLRRCGVRRRLAGVQIRSCKFAQSTISLTLQVSTTA